jgi:putative ABC transport system permease protein
MEPSMLRVALRALRSRRTQSITLMLLAALVSAAAVAAPFYVFAAGDKLSAHDIALAPADQRIVTQTLQVSVQAWGPDEIARNRDTLEKSLTLAGFRSVLGFRVDGTVTTGAITYGTSIADRDGVCAHVVVTGSCPKALNEVMISGASAGQFGASVGSTVTFRSDGLRTNGAGQFKVVGIYSPRQSKDPYWGNDSLAETKPANTQGNTSSDAMFGTTDTIVALNPVLASLTRDMVLDAKVLSGPRASALQAQIVDATVRLPSKGVPTASKAPILFDRIIKDSNIIVLGVPLGAAQLVLLGWFALFLAIRATAMARRADVGMLKLRGIPGRGLWALMIEQSTVPVLLGAPIGVVLGFLGARLMAGPVQQSDELRQAVQLAGASLVVVVLGSVVAALVAERRTLATPVIDLLRRTPPRRRGWQGDVTDLVLLAVAVAGIVQVRATKGSAASGLAALTPGLVALAVGLLTARAFMPTAAATVDSARRRGSVGAMLTATYLARRPGLDRIFALMAIAVTIAGYAILAWGSAAHARSDRANLVIGPARVLTVGTVEPTYLLKAVRAADPTGRYALAATESRSFGGRNVLAVDATRLAKVLPDGVPNGPSGAAIARSLRPASPETMSVTGTSIVMDATTVGLGATPASIIAELRKPDGTPIRVQLGPLSAGTHVYSATTPDCAPGCPVIGFSLVGDVTPVGPRGPADAGVNTTLREFAQLAPQKTLVDAAAFGNRAAWRGSFLPNGYGPILSTSDKGLTLEVAPPNYPGSTQVDPTAYPMGVPLPVPMLSVGQLPVEVAGAPMLAPFGNTEVPVRDVGGLPILPRVLNQGFLVDLEYAADLTRLSAGNAVDEVWLSADAPESIVDNLVAAGLTVTNDESVASYEAELAQQPAVVILRFQLLGGAIGLALAAVALLLVAAVERDPRASELVSLRVQGVNTRTAAAVVRRGYIILAVSALTAGVVGAIVDRYISGDTQSKFADGWHFLPLPPLIGLDGLAWLIGIAGVLLAVSAWLASYQLTRAVRARTKATSR